MVEGANLRAGSCEYNGKTYWGGQTIATVTAQCTEVKCKWSATGNPTVELVAIDGCTCTSRRSLAGEVMVNAAEHHGLIHGQTRASNKCTYNGVEKWGGAVLDEIAENCIKLVCVKVDNGQNYIDTKVTSGCTCGTTTTTTPTTTTTTTATTTTTTTTTTPTTTTPTTTTPTTTT